MQYKNHIFWKQYEKQVTLSQTQKYYQPSNFCFLSGIFIRNASTWSQLLVVASDENADTMKKQGGCLHALPFSPWPGQRPRGHHRCGIAGIQPHLC